MPMSPQELQELKDLEELDQLEALEKQSSLGAQVGGLAGGKVYKEPIGPEQASLIDRVSERVQDPARWQAIATNTGPYARDVVAGTPPLAAPAAMFPKLAQVGEALTASPVRRIAAGAAQGAISNPEDRTAGAVLGGGLATGAETITGIGRLLRSGVGGMGGLSPEQARVYQQFGEAVDAIKTARKESPEEVQDVLADLIKVSKDKTWQSSQDLINQRNKLGIGKNIEIRSADYLNPNTPAPVREEFQTIINKTAPPKTIPNPQHTTIVNNAGELVDTVPKTLTLPLKVPAKVTLPSNQADRLLDIVNKETKFAPPANIADIGAVKAGNKAAAKIGNDLRKGLEAVTPGRKELNLELAKNARASKTADRLLKSDPERLFTSNKLNYRAIAERLGKNTADNLRRVGEQYRTAQQIQALENQRAQGLFDGLNKMSGAAARGAIKNSGALSKALDPVSQDPVIIDTLFRLINQNKSEK